MSGTVPIPEALTMSRNADQALADRIVRPQRVGVLGPRAAGKTAMLAMLYREAIAGHFGGTRLSAADSRTAAYLNQVSRQLEQGHPPEPTTAPVEMRFILTHGDMRTEIVLLDHQGGDSRPQSVREFLRDCDAVWLCLPAANPAVPEEELEEALAGEEPRPLAVVLTKADQLAALGPGHIRATTDPLAGHPLTGHIADRATFAVSSTGPSGVTNDGQTVLPTPLAPSGLEGPLAWLADALHRLARTRLLALAEGQAPHAAFRKAVAVFRSRYPSDTLGEDMERRLQSWAILWPAAVALLCLALLVGLAGWHDARGAAWIQGEEERLRSDPAALAHVYSAYRWYYPTRHLFRPGEVAAQDRRADEAEYYAALEEIAAAMDRGDVAAEDLRVAYQRLRQESPAAPDVDETGIGQRLSQAIEARQARDARQAAIAHEKKSLQALMDLEKSTAPLEKRIADCDALVKRLGGAPPTRQARLLLSRLRRELDDRDATAQKKAELSKQRRAAGLTAYKKLCEAYRSRPGAVKELRSLAEAYLKADPAGRYRDNARSALRYCDALSKPGEYRVKLVSGVFGKSSAGFFNFGVSLAVKLEVGDETYGPSTIEKSKYDPEWGYTFPRRIKWKPGDSIRVIVTDHYSSTRTVSDVTFDGQSAIIELNDSTDVEKGTLNFDTDFPFPKLPRPD
jgi:hypothetical protein